MSRIKFILLLCLTTLACQSPLATATVTPTETATQTLIPSPTLTPTLTPTPIPPITPSPSPLTRRVLILSIDGFRPDAIPLAPMPFLTSLLERSAYSLHAQTVFPSVTLVSHTSMLS